MVHRVAAPRIPVGMETQGRGYTAATVAGSCPRADEFDEMTRRGEGYLPGGAGGCERKQGESGTPLRE